MPDIPGAREVRVIGDATLILGDCRDVLPSIWKVDATITDPPYGIGIGGHSANDGRSGHGLGAGYYESYDDTLENFRRVVVPSIRDAISISRRGLVFAAGHNAHELPKPEAVGGVYLPSTPMRHCWGFASLSICLLYGKAPNLHLGAKPTILKSTEYVTENNEHPCPKPLGWMLWAIDLASIASETVLDPFMGSGTTGVACAKMGRRFIGIEIEPKYFQIACRRIEQAYAQPDFFVPRPEKAKQEAMF